MLRPDFWRRSAARAEIDQRAREARLRLEHLERLLVLRVAPTQSVPRLVLDRRGLGFFSGRCMQSRSTKVAPPGARYGQARNFPTEICIAARRVTPFSGRVPQ